MRAMAQYTITIVNDGSNGAPGDGGTSVFVGNESVSLPCNPTGEIKQTSTITIPFVGYKGTSKVACSCAVGTLTTGITVVSNTAGTSSKDGVLVLSFAKDSTFGDQITGTITLTFTVNNTNVIKYFTWTKVGDGVSSYTHIRYAMDENGLGMTDKPSLWDSSGRNLLLDSSFPVSTTKWNLITEVSVDTSITFNGNNSIKILNVNTYRLDTPGQYFANYAVGEQLSLSFWIMSPDVTQIVYNVDSWIGFRNSIYAPNGAIQKRITPSMFLQAGNNNWFKITISGSNADISSIYCTFMLQANNPTATIYVSSPKLEKGTTPTPWTPAPEDYPEDYVQPYIGIATTDSAVAPTDPTMYTWMKYTGRDSTSYSLQLSSYAIVKSVTGSYNPQNIIANAYSQTGSNPVIDYPCRFIIEESTDMSTWTTKYTSSSDESDKTHVPSSGIKAIRFSMYQSGGITVLLDQQIIPIVYDGSNGNNGLDAYTVLLTNESHSFPASSTAAIAGSAISKVIAYKGATQMPTIIGTITGMPTGMTTSIQNNNSTTSQFTVSVTTSMVTTSGVLTIPITVDGKSFTKSFSYSLSKQGNPGTPGEDGKDAAIISATEPSDKSYLWCDISGDSPVLKRYNSENSIWVIVQDQSIIDTIYNEISTSIDRSEDKIRLEVSDQYYNKDDVDTSIGDIRTSLTQTAEDFTFQFESFTGLLTKLEDGKSNVEDVEEIKKYITFQDGVIIIGIIDNPFTLRISNDRISFMQNDSEVAYINNNKMYITEVETTTSLTIGNFQFVPRANGNLSFNKVV